MAVDQSKVTSDYRVIRCVGYLFAILAFAVFIYALFVQDEMEIRTQAIYWFAASLVAALAPNIKQIKYGDWELTLQGLQDQVTDLSDKVTSLEESFLSRAGAVQSEEQSVTDRQRKERQASYDRFAKRLKELPSVEQLDEQYRETRYQLFGMGLSISMVKQALHDAGVYRGQIDDNFDQGFAEAVTTFQVNHNLRPADGVFGHRTYLALQATLNGQRQEHVADVVSKAT